MPVQLVSGEAFFAYDDNIAVISMFPLLTFLVNMHRSVIDLLALHGVAGFSSSSLTKFVYIFL